MLCSFNCLVRFSASLGLALIAATPAAADPARASTVSLKEVTITFAAGTTWEEAEPSAMRLAEAARSIESCADAEKVASEFEGTVYRAHGGSSAAVAKNHFLHDVRTGDTALRNGSGWHSYFGSLRPHLRSSDFRKLDGGSVDRGISREHL
jgi:hypothetical protein